MKIKDADNIACPHCGATLDGATDYGSMADGGDIDNERQPEHDDVTVCMYCFHPLRFVAKDGKLSLRMMPKEEVLQLPPEMLMTLVMAIGAAKRVMARQKDKAH